MKKWILGLVLFVLVFAPITLFATGSEMDVAIDWLYQNGLTKYSNAADFMMDRNIRRDEASKFFSQFASNVLENNDRISIPMCSKFSDVSSQNTMKSFIVDACLLWFMKWSNGKFNPSGSLSNAQALAVIIRIIEWEKNESWTHWADVYYTRAEQLWLLTYLSLSDKDVPITRGKLGILLYRAYNIITYGPTTYTKPDLIINSVWLNPNYPAPKVSDQYIYIDFTIKNLGKSIVFSSGTTSWIFSCRNNGIEIIHKEIINGTIQQGQIFSIGGVRSTSRSDVSLFMSPENNYTLDCSLQLESNVVREGNATNNGKSFSFAVTN